MHALTAAVRRIRTPAHPDPPTRITQELFQKQTEIGNSLAQRTPAPFEIKAVWPVPIMASQRRHMSDLCSAESLTRLPCLINTAFRKMIHIRRCCIGRLRPSRFQGNAISQPEQTGPLLFESWPSPLLISEAHAPHRIIFLSAARRPDYHLDRRRSHACRTDRPPVQARGIRRHVPLDRRSPSEDRPTR
jgi:hypothetical protein